MMHRYEEDRSIERIGVLLGVLVLLWGVNALALWAFGYPAIYCLAASLVTPGLVGWYRVLGMALLLYMMIAAIARGPSTLPINVGVILLYYMAPVWFEILFGAGVGCGSG